MDYVRLGKSELVSSVVGLGGGSSGRFGLAKGGTKSDAISLIRTAVDEGITFFDGAGICENVDGLMADALADCRQRVIVSTKVHLGPDPFPLSDMRLANKVSFWISRRRGLVCTGPALRRRVERTLKVLRTDHIDLLQLHAVTVRQYPLAVARVVPELLEMKAEGKLRAVGITEGFLADPGHAMLKAALSDDWFDTIMAGFNFSNASAAESVFPAARKADVGVIGMFAMRGLIGRRGAGDAEPGVPFESIDRLLEETGTKSLTELAYRYCRHQPGMDVVMTGTGDPEHLRENIAAALLPPLPSEVLDRLRMFSPARPV